MTDTEKKVLAEFTDVIEEEIALLHDHLDEIEPEELAEALLRRLQDLGIVLSERAATVSE